MSDERIRSSLQKGSAGEQPRDEAALVDQLMRRVETLEQEKRSWKRIALGTFLVLALLFVGGVALSVGGAAIYLSAIKREGARMEEMTVRQMHEAEMLRAQAEEARARAEAERLRLEMLRQDQNKGEDK